VLLGQAALLQSRVYTAWGHYAASLATLNTALVPLSGQPEALLTLHLCWAYTLWLDRQLGTAEQHLQRALALLPPLYAQPNWPPAGVAETVLETYPVLLHTWQSSPPYAIVPSLSQLLRLYPSPGRPALQFYCLGHPTLWVKNESHRFYPGRHSANYPALLAYLFHHPQGCSWPELALALWPDSPAKTASNALHQTLKRLRHKPLGDPTYLHGPANSYGLNPAYPTWSDGPVFDHLVQQLPHPPSAENLPHYLDLLHLYRGKFLAGFALSEWGLQRRQRYEDRFLQISHVTARFLLQQGQFWKALWVIERGLEQNYYREGLHRLALHAYAHIGLHSELRRHYQHLCQQLGHSPEPTTEQLYQCLRRRYKWGQGSE
jgi:DNA-binding SARP family transcriptional activator